jgi:hypothetical protein
MNRKGKGAESGFENPRPGHALVDRRMTEC